MSWITADTGSSGTTTPTIGTETTLITNTVNGTYVFSVDCSAMLPGDVLEMRVYLMVASGGTLRVIWKSSVGPIPPGAAPVFQAPPIPSAYSIKVTLKQTAGTARAYVWSLWRQ